MLLEFTRSGYKHFSDNPLTTAQKETICAKIAACLAHGMLHKIPSKPEEGKWTKDGPSVSWFVAIEYVLPLELLMDAGWGKGCCED